MKKQWEEEETEGKEEIGWIGMLHILGALKNQMDNSKKVIEKDHLFLEDTLNGKAVKTVDFKTTHNFIMKREVKWLGLKLGKNAGKMKTVNSHVMASTGLTKQVKVKLAEWEGPIDFVVISMDDFNVILGMEFVMGHNHSCHSCTYYIKFHNYGGQCKCCARKEAIIRGTKALICFTIQKRFEEGWSLIYDNPYASGGKRSDKEKVHF